MSDNQARQLCEAAQKVVADVTGITDVFVYGNSAQIKINIAPIEIWIEMSDYKVTDEDKLISDLKNRLSAWKTESSFSHPINLTLIPIHWKVEIDI